MTISVSMADYLRIVLPHISSLLVPGEALSKIRVLAENLPPLSVGLFECRLDKGQERVDFQVRYPCNTFNLTDSFYSLKTPEYISYFLKELDNFKHIIDYIWLEFDLIEDISLLPIPSIFLSFKKSFIDDYKLEIMAIQSLIKLLNCADPLAIESNIENCINLLPNQGRIAHVGAMLSRRSKTVKLVIKGISGQQLPEYLGEIGWKDSTNKLPTVISDVSNFVDSIALAFDVGEKIYPLIGLECFLDKQPFVDQVRWQSFLDNYLVKEGLCTPAKANALLTWPGISQKADHPELWPSNVARLDRFLSGKAISLFYRTINHIKIVYQPGRPLSAKAYLAFIHSYLHY